MDNKSKIDQLHDLMPAHFNTRTNPNWKALVTAIGESDQNIVDLITEVKKQFFIKTAYRPYLDNLAANDGVSRPKGVGMDDPTFKQFIPVMSYQPKQVKLIIDQLLNIFFAKETTTAFIESGVAAPYNIQDDWELEYKVDGVFDEFVYFRAADFTDINAATAQEIAAAINRQSKYSFAEDYYDSIVKGHFVKIFSNTIGSKGSIQIVGGRSNIALQFNGFIIDAGNGVNTQWTVTKVGDQVTFQNTGGTSPGINQLQVGNVFVSLIPGNVGSFVITNIELSSNLFTFTNLFGTPGVYTQTDATQTKFFVPNKYVVYTRNSRAVTWEVTPGEVTIEIPATPPVVKRSLIGAAHINGTESIVTATNSATSLTVTDASQFPPAGNFWLQEVDEIVTRYVTPSENTIASMTFNTRLQGRPTDYTYTSIVGNTLNGITPDLPTLAYLNENVITSITRTGDIVTVTTTMPHNYKVGDAVAVYGSDGILSQTSTGTITSGTKIITGVTPIATVAPGQLVIGANIPLGSLVENIVGTTVTMTENATGNGLESITFNENLNGGFIVTSVTSNTFTYDLTGMDGSVTIPGMSSSDRIGMSPTGSLVIVTTAIPSSVTGIIGPYVWDLSAPFVLSKNKATTVGAIQAGQMVPLLDLSSNTIPPEGGYVIFDYGLNTQEGPVRYLYAPNDTAIVIDPSYIFEHDHAIGSNVIALSHKGPHLMSGLGTEYPPYITNPSAVRITLENLIRSVASAGIFVDFLVRYPEQLYGTIDVYQIVG
jgi:hypothetical protein